MTVAAQPSASLYWKLVEDCLVSFYAFPRRQASQSVAAVRKRLKDAGVKHSAATDFAYHSEPIDVASDVAQQPFPAAADFPHRYEQLKHARLAAHEAHGSPKPAKRLPARSTLSEQLPPASVITARR